MGFLIPLILQTLQFVGKELKRRVGANRASKVLELIHKDKLGANRASKVLEFLSVLRESKERTRGWEPIELQKS